MYLEMLGQDTRGINDIVMKTLRVHKSYPPRKLVLEYLN